MKIIHKADERGQTELDWLHSRHSFSFGDYYDPKKMGFGALRVLNDDVIDPGKGFGTHPHNNMEIITIVLEGELAHKDSMGNGSVIYPGQVQVMSAGTGVAHSEFNHSKTKPVKLLQIWIETKEMGREPRYGEINFNKNDFANKLKTIVSGEKGKETLYIHQDASLSLGNFSNGKRFSYGLKKLGNGVYVFMIKGIANVSGETLNERDTIGLTGEKSLEIVTEKDSEILVIEVPMGK